MAKHCSYLKSNPKTSLRIIIVASFALFILPFATTQSQAQGKENERSNANSPRINRYHALAQAGPHPLVLPLTITLHELVQKYGISDSTPTTPDILWGVPVQISYFGVDADTSIVMYEITTTSRDSMTKARLQSIADSASAYYGAPVMVSQVSSKIIRFVEMVAAEYADSTTGEKGIISDSLASTLVRRTVYWGNHEVIVTEEDIGESKGFHPMTNAFRIRRVFENAPSALIPHLF